MSRKRVRDEVLSMIFAKKGAMSKLARKIGCSPQAVSLWTKVPEHHLEEVSEFSGIPAEKLRPDIAAKFDKANFAA